jgi:ETFB lysine methyltransferase
MTSSAQDFASLVESLRARFDVATIEVVAGGHTWQLLKPRNADDLLDEEEFEHDDRIPYWAELWPSARMLSDRLAQLDGRGQSMLELGCGVGLCALAAAKAGFNVVATDYYPEALEFVQANAWQNGVPSLGTRMVDWRHLPDDLGTFDVIIGADVLYERPYAELIAAAIDKHLAPGGTALVTDPGRRFASAFPDACRARPLRVIDADIIPLDHDGKEFTIELFTIELFTIGRA